MSEVISNSIHLVRQFGILERSTSFKDFIVVFVILEEIPVSDLLARSNNLCVVSQLYAFFFVVGLNFDFEVAKLIWPLLHFSLIFTILTILSLTIK